MIPLQKNTWKKTPNKQANKQKHDEDRFEGCPGKCDKGKLARVPSVIPVLQPG